MNSHLLPSALVALGIIAVSRLRSLMTTPAVGIDAQMGRWADDAVSSVAVRGVTLDYSPDSVKHVEAILAEFHEARTRGTLTDRDLDQVARQYGAYIGEVLRKKYGGHWALDHEVAGPNSYPIHWDGHDSFSRRLVWETHLEWRGRQRLAQIRGADQTEAERRNRP